MVQSSTRVGFAEMAQSLRNRNQRYLDYLKQSGDPADMRSRVLATILDGAADGLIVFDEGLRIVMANLASSDLAGWELEDTTRDQLRREYKFFLDEGITPLPHDEEPIVVATREKRPIEMVAFAISQHLPPPGRWVRAHASPIFDEQGQLLGGVTVFTDITDRLKLMRQRDCLAALITHDIKNHLLSEQMFFDLLEDSQNISAEDLGIVADIRAASEKFRQIADSLLDVFRANIFADTQFAQPVDIVAVVNRAVALTELEATNRRITVSTEFGETQPIVRGLPGVISHVIHNLIQNAIEASAADSRVLVKVSLSSTSEFVTIQVSDGGVGMTAAEVAMLFSPPEVAGRMSATVKSSGFGLYLSHMLIESQGGSMTCTSQPGEGTTLTVIMPLQAGTTGNAS